MDVFGEAIWRGCPCTKKPPNIRCSRPAYRRTKTAVSFQSKWSLKRGHHCKSGAAGEFLR